MGEGVGQAVPTFMTSSLFITVSHDTSNTIFIIEFEYEILVVLKLTGL